MTEAAAPSAADVLVIGEALIDIVETASGTTEHVGGSPANVALGLGRRDVRTALLTQIGDDAYGRLIAGHLAASGVHVLPQSTTDRPTSTAVAHIGADGQAEYVFNIRWGGFDSPPPGARLIHTGSIAAFLRPGAAAVHAALEQAGDVEITFDPNIRPVLLGEHSAAVRAFERTAGLATVVKMSDEDAAWLYPRLGVDAVIDAVLERGPRLVAITLGAQGAVLATREHQVSVSADPVRAVDTIGAGDTFMASLIHSVLTTGTRDLDRAQLFELGTTAARAAAITVSRAGADLPWSSEVERPAPAPVA